MPDNFSRRISSSNPSHTQPVDPPRRDSLLGLVTFDSRYLAWRVRNPNHPHAHDKYYVDGPRWPRLQADDSCNRLQLYEYIEYYLAEYQMEFKHYNGNSRVLLMPYQIITPEPGWKLQDVETGIVYTVKDVDYSKDFQRRSVFDGRILLEDASGPPENNKIIWIDPYGEDDEKPKLIRVIHSEEVRNLIGNRESQGDVAEVKMNRVLPVVGYKLIREEPGSINGMPFSPNRELAGRTRMVVKSPETPDLEQVIEGQWLDTIIAFEIFAIGPKIADRLSMWLKNFFLLYNGVLTKLGVQRIFFWTQETDKEENRTVNDLSIRSLQYYFRLEDLYIKEYGLIRSYNTTYKLSGEFDPIPWFTSEPTSELFPTDTSGTLPLYGTNIIGDD